MSRPPDRLEPLLPDDPDRIGPFPLVARIGAGGMGAVYASGSPSLGYTAVKVIHPRLAEDADFRARFAREIDLVRRVDTPYAPAFRGGEADADPPWLATRYVPGPNVWDEVHENGPLPTGPLLGLAAGTAECLTALHGVGIVHRDLKPGNVLLAEDGPKVLDFGIARALGEQGLTRTGQALGSPGWVPPEVMTGSPGPDPARDVFTWGGIVAFAASGRPPFGTGSLATIARRTARGEPDLGEELSGPLRDLVQRAMDKDPERRPTAAEVLSAVTVLWDADGAPTLDVSAVDERTRVDTYLQQHWHGYGGPLPDVPRSPGRAKARRRTLIAAGAALAGVAATGLGYVFLPLENEAAAPPGTDDPSVPWPPPEAEQETDNLGNRNTVHLLDDESEAPDRAPLVFGPDDQGAEFHAHEARPVGNTPTGSWAWGTQAALAVPEMREDAVVFNGAMPFSQESLTPDMFTLVSPQGRYTPVEDFELEYEVAMEQGEDEQWWADEDRPYHTFTLTFPGAPEQGLISFGTTDYEPDAQGSAPVGICYQVDGEFTLDYEECG